MRPRSEMRQALTTAARQIATERGTGFTWRDVARRAQVGWEAARVGVKVMARDGELQRIGSARQPQARRPMTLFALASPPSGDGTTALDTIMRTWAR